MKALDVHGLTRAQLLHAGAARTAAAGDAHEGRVPALAAPCERGHPGELLDDLVRSSRRALVEPLPAPPPPAPPTPPRPPPPNRPPQTPVAPPSRWRDGWRAT